MNRCPSYDVDKAALRQQMRDQLAALPPLVRAQEEELVNAHVVSDPVWDSAGTVFVYRAKAPELSVVSATNAAFRAGKRVCFPRIVGPGRMEAHAVAGWSELAPADYGILAPPADAPIVDPADIEVAIVPGLAWDASGRRLGQGGGFFDRWLPRLGGVSWGVAFAVQIVSEVPTQAHDVRVDRVIGPQGPTTDPQT